MREDENMGNEGLGETRDIEEMARALENLSRVINSVDSTTSRLNRNSGDLERTLKGITSRVHSIARAWDSLNDSQSRASRTMGNMRGASIPSESSSLIGNTMRGGSRANSNSKATLTLVHIANTLKKIENNITKNNNSKVKLQNGMSISRYAEKNDLRFGNSGRTSSSTSNKKTGYSQGLKNGEKSEIRRGFGNNQGYNLPSSSNTKHSKIVSNSGSKGNELKHRASGGYSKDRGTGSKAKLGGGFEYMYEPLFGRPLFVDEQGRMVETWDIGGSSQGYGGEHENVKSRSSGKKGNRAGSLSGVSGGTKTSSNKLKLDSIGNTSGISVTESQQSTRGNRLKYGNLGAVGKSANLSNTSTGYKTEARVEAGLTGSSANKSRKSLKDTSNKLKDSLSSIAKNGKVAMQSLKMAGAGLLAVGSAAALAYKSIDSMNKSIANMEHGMNQYGESLGGVGQSAIETQNKFNETKAIVKQWGIDFKLNMQNTFNNVAELALGLASRVEEALIKTENNYNKMFDAVTKWDKKSGGILNKLDQALAQVVIGLGKFFGIDTSDSKYKLKDRESIGNDMRKKTQEKAESKGYTVDNGKVRKATNEELKKSNSKLTSNKVKYNMTSAEQASARAYIASSSRELGFDSKSLNELSSGTIEKAFKLAQKSGEDTLDVVKKIADAWRTGKDTATEYGIVVNDDVLAGWAALKHNIDIVNVKYSDAMLAGLRYQMTMEQASMSNTKQLQDNIKKWKQQGQMIKENKDNVSSFEEVLKVTGYNPVIPEIEGEKIKDLDKIVTDVNIGVDDAQKKIDSLHGKDVGVGVDTETGQAEAALDALTQPRTVDIIANVIGGETTVGTSGAGGAGGAPDILGEVKGKTFLEDHLARKEANKSGFSMGTTGMFYDPYGYLKAGGLASIPTQNTSTSEFSQAYKNEKFVEKITSAGGITSNPLKGNSKSPFSQASKNKEHINRTFKGGVASTPLGGPTTGGAPLSTPTASGKRKPKVDAISGAAKSKPKVNRPSTQDMIKNIRGHANGGISTKEHIANISEGNRAEAIIPLQSNVANPAYEQIASSIVRAMTDTQGLTGGSTTINVGQGSTIIGNQHALRQLATMVEQGIALNKNSRGELDYGIRK